MTINIAGVEYEIAKIPVDSADKEPAAQQLLARRKQLAFPRIERVRQLLREGYGLVTEIGPTGRPTVFTDNLEELVLVYRPVEPGDAEAMATSTLFAPEEELPPAIRKLERRLKEVEAINPGSLEDLDDTARSLTTRVNATLMEIFGAASAEFKRARANEIDFRVMSSLPGIPRAQKIAAFAKGQKGVVSKLRDEVAILRERMEEFASVDDGSSANTETPDSGEKVGSATPAARHNPTVVITPTIYGAGQVFVANSIQLNWQSADFREFKAAVDQVLVTLRGSNEFSQEEKAQLSGEVKGGVEILSTPKPSRGIIDLYLVGPLKYIAEKAANTAVGMAATHAFKLLAKLIGIDL